MRKWPSLRPKFRFSLSIRQQIGAIGLLGVLGVVLLGVTYLAGYMVQVRIQRSADDTALLKNETVEFAQNLLDARRLSVDFLLRGDEKRLPEHAGLLTEATNRLDRVDGLISGLDSARAGPSGLKPIPVVAR